MAKFDFKPGDLIEWVYMHNHKLVVGDEKLWSKIDNDWIPIGSKYIHMCISVDDDVYS